MAKDGKRFVLEDGIHTLLYGNYKTKTEKRRTDDPGLSLQKDHPQLILKYGYPVERYEVITEDGYCLVLFCIPSGTHSNRQSKNRSVLLQHGLSGSSADWLLFGPSNSLGFLLADEGYDVWFGNARGNFYSKGHANLTSTHYKFWSFSFHEVGLFDIPAMIDFILKRTGRTDLYYVGYSSGATDCFVLCSEKPEYNSKIRAIISIAPLVFVSNMGNNFMEKFITNFPNFKMWMNWKHQYEFPSGTEIGRRIGQYVCKGQVSVLCNNVLYPFAGYELTDIDKKLVPVIFNRAPTGTSLKTLEHYFQEVHSGKFRQFDYGVKENRKRYGQSFPPNYDLSHVKARVAIISSEGDIFSTKEDMDTLYRNLPNVFSTIRIKMDDFKHFDFIIGNDAKNLVYNEVLLVLRLAEDLADDEVNILLEEQDLFDFESDTESIIINFQNNNG